MYTERITEQVAMKGTVSAVLTLGHIVQIWINSPTGDSSDSNIMEITCVNSQQAKVIARHWVKAWGLEGYSE